MEIKAPEVFTTFDEKHELQVFHLAKGEGVPAHQHQQYAHDVFVLFGAIRASVGPIANELAAPSTIHFPNGALHSFEATVDGTVVATLHPH